MPTHPSARPDPDTLLAQLKADSERAARGALKIFFGANPGVGKTYAMLTAARAQQQAGVDVVVGLVETHGRSETAALLDGLDVLPRRAMDVAGHTRHEFDLDAALDRKPGLILVDELAHSNAPGARHAKRWQDIDELLGVGIDVWTTVNVQHLETLNDVVGNIVGVRVNERVPDRVFDAADEVVLVDLPPDELLVRLAEGKVYLPGPNQPGPNQPGLNQPGLNQPGPNQPGPNQPSAAERAAQHFFRKGNLLALRELALRRTADRVDVEVTEYRRAQTITPVWQTQGALLACIGPEPDNDKLVRSAARLAAQFNVPWHVVYVETPRLARLPRATRATTLKILQLAASLGATTATLPGADAADAALNYARAHNLSKVVLGRRSVGRSGIGLGARRWPWQRRFSNVFGARAPDLDLILVELGAAPRPVALRTPKTRTRWPNYAWVSAAVVLITLAATPLHDLLELTNIVMLYLLVVLIAGAKLGRGPAMLGAVLSVAAFDFFFVLPKFTFAVHNLEYLLTFVVMLAVALTTAQLTAGLRFQAQVAENRERRVRALFDLSRALSAALTADEVAAVAGRTVATALDAETKFLLPDAAGKLPKRADSDADTTTASASADDVHWALDPGIAQWALDHGECAGRGTATLAASRFVYVPLKGTLRVRGVLALSPRQREALSPEQQRLLDTFAALIGIALERVHYIEVAQHALVGMESERLRNTLLASLSHDLRTPLTALVGGAEALLLAEPPLTAAHARQVEALREHAERTRSQVEKLLDMARLQAGSPQLTRDWMPLEEPVGAALAACDPVLGQHRVELDLPEDLPLLELDAVLIERVFSNLFENAARYTPPGSHIRVAARVEADTLVVDVSDTGPGLPPGREAQLFDKFARGEAETQRTGMGLGLAIVRAIVEAHGGRVSAHNAASGGACFRVQFPLGTPPDTGRAQR